MFPQKKLTFVRPVLQKTLAKWMLQSWTYPRRKNLRGVEKYRMDKRCVFQIPSLGEFGLRTKSKQRLCQKLTKNRSKAAGCISNHKMALSQAGICRLSERHCVKDVTASEAGCSAFSARHLTVGAESCSAPLFTLSVPEPMETENCLTYDNSCTSGWDGDGTTSALKNCKHKEGEQMVHAEASEIAVSRNFPNCVKLCASACEEGPIHRKNRVLNIQPCQPLKITSLRTEGKKSGNQPQTFCDAFSQFLKCSRQTMDEINRKTEEKGQCSAQVPLDCNKFSDLRTNTKAKTQLNFSKEMLPELRSNMSFKETPDFSDEATPILKTCISPKLQLGFVDETFSHPVMPLSSKASLICVDEKLHDIGPESPFKGQSDYKKMSGTFETDSESIQKLNTNNQSENKSLTNENIFCVDNSISDVKNLVSDSYNCTIQSICKFPETVDINATTAKIPKNTDLAGNLVQYATTQGKLISAGDNGIGKGTIMSANDSKDNQTAEPISSCAVRRVTLLKGFTDAGLNSEHEQQNVVELKATMTENLDSGISDSEQASSRHTTDSSQGSLGVMDAADVTIQTIDHVAMETAEDAAMKMSNSQESESNGVVPAHYNHSSVEHPDASAEELDEESTDEDCSDSDASNRLRVLESHCRPVRVLLRRLTLEAIDSFCSQSQQHSVKPVQPEESPLAKTPKKKDPLMAAAKPRQPKSPKSDMKKRKPKPPSWSKDDLAECITLDLMNWLPELVDDGTNTRRSSNATKRKFDGSVSDESLDGSTPYIPNFMTHANFEPQGCSLLEKWRNVCELEKEWLQEIGVIAPCPSNQPTTTMRIPPRTGGCFSALNKPGNISLDKSQRKASTEPVKRKTKPRKKDVTGAALDEDQSKTPTKTKPRKQSKKTEVDVSDEASSDISSLPSCQNSAKPMQKVTVVGDNSFVENTNSGDSLNDRKNLTRNTIVASPPNEICITKRIVVKSCLNGNVIAGRIASGSVLTGHTDNGNASIADSEIKNTLIGNDSTGNSIAATLTNTGTRNTPTGNTTAASFVVRSDKAGSSHIKNSLPVNLIVIDSVSGKAKARVSSGDKPETVINSGVFSLPGKTEPESLRINKIVVDSGLIPKLTTDRVQFVQQKAQSYKISVLPQVTNTKQMPVTLSLDLKRTTPPVSDSNCPPLKRSKNSVIGSESQTPTEKLKSSNGSLSSAIASKPPAVASTSSRPSQVSGKLSIIRHIRPAVACTSKIPATIASTVQVIAGISSSPARVTSIEPLTSTASSSLSSVSSSLVSVVSTDSKSVNSISGRTVAKAECLASSSSNVTPPQIPSAGLGTESDPCKVSIVTIHSVSDDLKSSSTQVNKSRSDSTEMTPPKLKQKTKPRVRPTAHTRNSLVANCNSDTAASSLTTLKKTFVACKLRVKASAVEPKQTDEDISEPKCNDEMSSWLAASMGL